MSRTTLCVITAVGLVAASAGLMVTRYQVLGEEIHIPRGPNTWKVTMKITGATTANDARVATLTPLDFARQHIKRESYRSVELREKPPAARHPERRQVLWSPRAGAAAGPFLAYYEFYCVVDVHRPNLSMARLTQTLYAPPETGEHLQTEPRIQSDAPEVSELARHLVAGRDGTVDQLETLYQYVDAKVGNEPRVGEPGQSAVDCLKNRRGDCVAKNRLLVALCRNRGIAARLVTGLRLVTKDPNQAAHVWTEAWVRDQWLPMCPVYHHYGRMPSNYLILGFGDLPVVRGRKARDLDYAFLTERTLADGAPGPEPSLAIRWLKALSLDSLPPPEERLVEFLLLLPIAALIVCVARNVIGVTTFGTFAPALVGLAFREVHSLPGILVFVSVVLVGWGLRRVLDRYHLLQVPRTAFMLSLVVVMLIGCVVAANFQPQPIEATKYIPLFPMVILTGMIERFWTLETEDGTSSSFKTLLATMVVSGTIALVLSLRAVVDYMFLFPETLGLIMATQLLIGRYTGYRVSELFRFRDFVQGAEA
jgi:hypothetical protein